MTPTLRPGEQLASTVCTTRVVVVRAPAHSPVLTCGGAAMVTAPADRPAAAPVDAVTLLGKRYVDASEEFEVLCTFSGTGELCCDGVPMTNKTAKPLPASD